MARVSMYKYDAPVPFSRRVIPLVLNFLLISIITLVCFGLCDFFITSFPGSKSYELTAEARDRSAKLQEQYEELEPEIGEAAAVRKLTATEEYARLAALRESLVQMKIQELAAVYFVLSILYFMVPLLLLKNHVSIPEHMLGMAACMRNGNQASPLSVFLKWAGEVSVYFNSIYLTLILTYSENSTAFFRQELLLGIRFSTFYFLSLSLLLFSFISCMAGRRNHPTFSDLISGQTMKDIRAHS